MSTGQRPSGWGREVSSEEEAEIRMFVERQVSGLVSDDEAAAALAGFHRRGLHHRYQQLRSALSESSERLDVIGLAEQWRSSIEWILVRDALAAISGDEGYATRLATTDVLHGLLWVHHGRGPLDVESLARRIWAERNVVSDLGTALGDRPDGDPDPST